MTAIILAAGTFQIMVKVRKNPVSAFDVIVYPFYKFMRVTWKRISLF